MSKKKKVIKMENTVNGVFDALYDLSIRVVQAEKIIDCKAEIATLLSDKFELQNQRDELQKEFNKAISKRNKCIESLNILNEQLDELQKQRDEFKIFIESNIIAKGFESIEIENLAKKLIKKYKP